MSSPPNPSPWLPGLIAAGVDLPAPVPYAPPFPAPYQANPSSAVGPGEPDAALSGYLGAGQPVYVTQDSSSAPGQTPDGATAQGHPWTNLAVQSGQDNPPPPVSSDIGTPGGLQIKTSTTDNSGTVTVSTEPTGEQQS